MDDGTVTTTTRELQRGRVDAALRHRGNWEQLVKFCVVGATGYVVNLVVYTLLLEGAGLHYVPAAIGSFLVAVTNNYAWNRMWTFRGQRGHVVFQGLRFLVVSTIALGAVFASPLRDPHPGPRPTSRAPSIFAAATMARPSLSLGAAGPSAAQSPFEAPRPPAKAAGGPAMRTSPRT